MGKPTVDFWNLARPLDSHAEFYRATYGSSEARISATSRVEVQVIDALLGAGEISCAAAPDLVVVVVHDRPTVSVDIGAGRFTRRMVKRAGLLIPPHTPTSAYAQSPHRASLLCIRWSYVLTLAQDTALPADGGFGALHAGPLGPSAALDILDRIKVEVEAGNPHGALFLDGAVMALVAALALSARAPIRLPPAGLASWQVRRTTEYLADRLAEPVTLAELAAIARLSPFHFARAFKATTGDPPHRYHTRLRIERAKEMLERTGLPMTEVAQTVGYDSPQSLARAFRRMVGNSPTEWRRQRRI